MPRKYSFYWVSTRWLIDDQLNEFDLYSDLVEKSLGERSDALVEQYQQHMAEASDEHKEYLADSYADEGIMLVERFPQLLRQSLFISIYAFLEQRLIGICEHYEHAKPTNVLLADLVDNGIIKCKTYLSKVVQIEFPESTHSWQQLLKYNKLRNQLVHVGPKLASGRPGGKLQNTIVQLDDVAVDSRREIVLGTQFCRSAVQTVRDFVADLFCKLPQGRESNTK